MTSVLQRTRSYTNSPDVGRQPKSQSGYLQVRARVNTAGD